MLWFILFFSVAAFGATEWWSRAVLECLIFFFTAMCLASNEVVLAPNRLLPGLVAVALVGVFQLLSPRPLTGPAAFAPFTVAAAQTTYALRHWTALSAFCWCSASLLSTPEAVERLLRAIFGIGLFIAIVGICQRGAGNTAYYGLRPIREGNPFGPFTNYDHAANWMAGAMCCGLGVLTQVIRRRRRRPFSESAAKTLIVLFGVGVLGAAVWESASRGAINALCLSGLVVSLWLSASISSRRLRLGARTLIALFAVSYCGAIWLNPKWIGLSGGILDISAAYRLSMYRSSLKMIADFPLFGVGLGATQVAFHPYQEWGLKGIVDHIHSSWLEIFLEAGLVGFVAVLSGAAWSVHALGSRGPSFRADNRFVLVVLLAAPLALLLHGFVEFGFQIPANALLLIALLSSAGPLTAPTAESLLRRTGVRLSIAAIVVAFAIVSLTSGFEGGRPRIGAPFLVESELLWSRHLVANNDAAKGENQTAGGKTP